MSQTYTVSYNINVVGVEAARTAINQFTTATKKLTQATQPFQKLNNSINNLKNRLNSLAQKAPTIQIKTADAERKLDRLIGKLRQYQREARKAGAITFTAPTPRGRGATSTGGGSSSRATTAAVTAASARNAIVRNLPKNIGYKALGPTPLDVGGIGAINLLKGMGIAYGIAGLGTLVSNVVQDAAAYDNSMQTVRNILATHDKRGGFDSRFKGMERIVRDVGMQTKFTAPEVADAAKFLAMAGFNLEGISQSISPIADIALVGDTELGETADVVTNIMTGYGIAPSRVKNAADVMTMTFTKSNTTLLEMAEAYQYAASLLSMNGTSFEEATAALGILGDAGIKGSQAGTTMRTITLNIAKPTKQQAKMWEQLGVDRLDKNGNVRDLYSIFRDLHDKNLNITQLGSLFHKTAAMGAGVLTNHVDKWNEIIEQNFLSEGLTQRLADEKKNTIQGLWAQLTSAFTEDGIQAFEGVQAPIRDMLKSITSWLQTPEAAQTFKTIAKDFLEFAKMMKDATVWIFQLAKVFKPFIKLWLQFQIYMWPVLTGIRVFKAAIIGLGVVTKAVGWISMLIGKIGLLGRTMIATNRTAGGFWRGMWMNMQNAVGWAGNTAGGYMQAQYLSGVTGRQISPAVAARWQQMYGKSWGPAFGKGIGMVGSFGAGIGGAMAGSWLGSKIGEEGSTVSNVESIVGGIAGGIGATALIGKLGALVPMLACWPVAIAGAVAAIGYLGYKMWQHGKEIDNAIEAHNKYLSSIATLNGISYSEHATEADKYYSIIYNRQLDTNQAIGEHIKLVREQLGLIDEAKQKLESETKFKDSHKDIYENLAKPFGAWSDKEDWFSATQAIYQNGQLVPYLMPTLQRQYDANGNVYDMYAYNGHNFNPAIKNHMSILAAAKQLTAMGHDTSLGTEAQQIIDANRQRILRTASISDYNAIIADVWSQMNSRSWIAGSEQWNVSDIGNKTEAELHNSYHYVYGLQQAVKEQFQIDNPNTPFAKLLVTFAEIIRAYENQTEVADETLQKFLNDSGIDIFDKSRYGVFGSDEWLRKLGYYDGKWNPLTYTESYVDADGQTKTRQRQLTAEEAQRHFMTFHQQIIDTVQRLSPAIQPYFNSFLNHSIWDLGRIGGIQGTGRSMEGQIHQSSDGQYYKYQNGKWYTCDANGNVTATPRLPIDDAVFRRENNMDGTSTTTTTTTPTVSTYTPPKRDYNSDYRSSYRDNSAAPKQVIVKIENLMNVESVDLSNPDNKAVIHDLKGQLTQALVDVVHDFDETWHG